MIRSISTTSFVLPLSPLVSVFPIQPLTNTSTHKRTRISLFPGFLARAPSTSPTFVSSLYQTNQPPPSEQSSSLSYTFKMKKYPNQFSVQTIFRVCASPSTLLPTALKGLNSSYALPTAAWAPWCLYSTLQSTISVCHLDDSDKKQHRHRHHNHPNNNNSPLHPSSPLPLLIPTTPPRFS